MYQCNLKAAASSSFHLIFNIKKYEEKGRAEGRVEGRAEGKTEAIEMMVMNMLHQKLNDEIIIQVTHISPDDLAKCKAEFEKYCKKNASKSTS